MTGLSTTSETIQTTALGGAIHGFADREQLITNHSSDRLKGEAEEAANRQVGGLERVFATISSDRRCPLTIGKTVACRGAGRSAPIPFDELRRNSHGGVESGGSFRLGEVSVN